MIFSFLPRLTSCVYIYISPPLPLSPTSLHTFIPADYDLTGLSHVYSMGAYVSIDLYLTWHTILTDQDSCACLVIVSIIVPDREQTDLE